MREVGIDRAKSKRVKELSKVTNDTSKTHGNTK